MALTAAEAALYRALNRVVEPAVRAGIGSPCVFAPAGLIVLETRGQSSGLARAVPLFAMLVDGHAVASTLRVRTSQWLRNAQQCPEVRYWLGGRVHEARAHVVMPGDDAPAMGDDGVNWLLEALRAPAAALGAAFVVLVPQLRDHT
jgi:hypothetical protein